MCFLASHRDRAGVAVGCVLVTGLPLRFLDAVGAGAITAGDRGGPFSVQLFPTLGLGFSRREEGLIDCAIRKPGAQDVLSPWAEEDSPAVAVVCSFVALGRVDLDVFGHVQVDRA